MNESPYRTLIERVGPFRLLLDHVGDMFQVSIKTSDACAEPMTHPVFAAIRRIVILPNVGTIIELRDDRRLAITADSLRWLENAVLAVARCFVSETKYRNLTYIDEPIEQSQTASLLRYFVPFGTVSCNPLPLHIMANLSVVTAFAASRFGNLVVAGADDRNQLQVQHFDWGEKNQVGGRWHNKLLPWVAAALHNDQIAYIQGGPTGWHPRCYVGSVHRGSVYCIKGKYAVLPAGVRPRGVHFTPDGVLWVYSDDEVYRYDPEAHQFSEPICRAVDGEFVGIGRSAHPLVYRADGSHEVLAHLPVAAPEARHAVA